MKTAQEITEVAFEQRKPVGECGGGWKPITSDCCESSKTELLHNESRAGTLSKRAPPLTGQFSGLRRDGNGCGSTCFVI